MWHYCGYNVTAARHGALKFHFATSIWTSDARPSPKCIQCCPYGPTAFNGTGGSLCDCNAKDLRFHDPPLIFNMSSDPTESHPLTPQTLPNFDQEVANIRQKLAEHYATMAPAPDQMHSLPDAALQLCCNGRWPFASCECNIYQRGHVFP
jgi:hypothetical protein